MREGRGGVHYVTDRDFTVAGRVIDLIAAKHRNAVGRSGSGGRQRVVGHEFNSASPILSSAVRFLEIPTHSTVSTGTICSYY